MSLRRVNILNKFTRSGHGHWHPGPHHVMPGAGFPFHMSKINGRGERSIAFGVKFILYCLLGTAYPVFVIKWQAAKAGDE